MPDNLKIRQPQDPRQINVNEPWELNYWCKTLNVTPVELRRAVSLVGTQTEKVKKYLKK